ncbi:MAG TPA: DUF6247 family protein [Actinomycetota bacterium]|nr:DUF6247 family protein [Actinomycetota bacterium]
MSTASEDLEQARLARVKNIALTDRIVDVLDALSQDGAKQFASELLRAMAQAKKDDDITPINRVIEEWYRTMLFVEGNPGFRAAYDNAHDPNRERRPMSVEDIHRRRTEPAP